MDEVIEYHRESDCWYEEIEYLDEYYDEIMDAEYDNDDECIHKKYYIGSYWYENYENIIEDAKTVKISTFYNFTNNYISNYISLWGGLPFTPTIEIIQVIMNDDGTYKHIIKTFWIKIIQRKWKKIMQEKKNTIKKQICSFSNIFQVTSIMKNSYKGLYGMNL
jgi:hypothetical protein